MQPNRITILHDRHCCSFTIVSEDYAGHLSVAEWLCFDEMLGAIARMYCPTMDDGQPNRFVGRPLFLKPITPDKDKDPGVLNDP